MADLTITSANVIAAAGANTSSGTCGQAISTGEPVYIDSTDGNRVKPADADTEAAAAAVGISLHATADEQPIAYITSGNLAVGAILTVGEVYCVSTNTGKIAPFSDITTGDYVTILGVATTTSNIAVNINASGAVTP